MPITGILIAAATFAPRAASHGVSGTVVSRSYPLSYSFKGQNVDLGVLHAYANLDGVYQKNIAMSFLSKNWFSETTVPTFLTHRTVCIIY